MLRRTYDHRIKAQVILTGNRTCFPELEIPRSTALSWIRRGMSNVVALDEDSRNDDDDAVGFCVRPK